MTNIQQNQIVKTYFVLTYFLALWLVSDSIPFASTYEDGWLPFGFMLITFVLYGLYYLLPSILLTKLASLVNQKLKLNKPLFVLITAILTGAVITLLLYANAKIFSLYGMFFNGFILNLLLTPGGIESLGGSNASQVGFGAIALSFIAVQTALMWLAHFLNAKKTTHELLIKIPYRMIAPVALITTIVIHMGFALDSYKSNQLTMVAESIPFYQTVSARDLFKKLGFTINRDTKLKVKGKLNYPLNPIKFNQPVKPYNIIWLTSESWRADMLNEKVMPNTWQFAANAARYTRNYSGGNGTRMGVFSMFMGMPGNYWFPFMQARRGAAIINVLQQQHYQTSFYTSALFSYPEFDQTIFAQVPENQLHTIQKGQTGWENDRDNVSNLLSFIDNRDTARPFFTFMFFESPHARYYFPENSIIATPYRDDLNYATLSKEQLRNDIAPIKNRYINSVHHLDMQFGRIFDYLKQHQLLDNTIVILNGDHGEEFMEHGFWGHNSTFVDQQVHTPFVIYTPEMKPFVSNQLTSHMDVVPTLMPLLGVTNPSKDYATGVNLLAGEKRNHTYIADWDRIVYVDDEVKITQPVNGKGFALLKVSKGNDDPLSKEERTAILVKKQPALLQLVNDLSKFFKKKESISLIK
ncbi:MAG TPA: sulfatase-like hydrolase/transferase [Methylotenera sp.]|nr:sulfatase-like hydrolase/transferase [Methylotenera sp.]